MYQCKRCGTFFDISENHRKYILRCIKEVRQFEAICTCPICDIKIIVGGEPDSEGILLYTKDFDEKCHTQYKVFQGTLA